MIPGLFREWAAGLCPVCGERPSEPAFSGCCSVQCERAMYAEREELDRLRAAAPEVSRCAD